MTVAPDVPVETGMSTVFLRERAECFRGLP